jgi:ADP-ribose pyrophosphatase YjhB (NUDIX family)
VEWFETCIEAIKRECHEEIGVKVEVDRLLTVVDHIVRESGVHWVSLEYLVHINDGNPRNADEKENYELRWFPLDVLPEALTQPSREAVRCIRVAAPPAASARGQTTGVDE